MSDSRLYIFCWHDKVDHTYLADSVRIHRSKRSMCRGYLTEFEQNKKMNFNEFELCVVGEFDESTGLVTRYDTVEVLDPRMVYAKEDE